MLYTTTIHAQIFSVSKKKATLLEIFGAVKEQTGYWYSFSGKRKVLNQKVSAGFKDLPLQEFLDDSLPQHGLTYSYNRDNPKIIQLREIGYASSGDTSGLVMLPRIEGLAVRERSELLPNITVWIKGTDRYAVSDTSGWFYFINVPSNATLQLTGVNVQPEETGVTNKQMIIVHMKDSIKSLGEVTVVGNGIIKVDRNSTVGSFDVVPKSLLDRNSSPYLFERIDNTSSGVLINHGSQAPDGSSQPDGAIIRGPSTLNGNSSALVIVDDFPYYGDINNIPPNDIENITFLKEADASSIWGARAGNGVIVIKTKKGRTRRPVLVFSNIISFRPRPDVFNVHTISSSDYIDMEKYLYGQGYYTPYFGGPFDYAPVTPVVWLLHEAEIRKITQQQADAEIEKMKSYDVRRDIQQNLYRSSLEQQYSLQLSQQTSKISYAGSVGLVRSTGNLVGTSYSRATARMQTNFILSSRLELTTSMTYATTLNSNGNNPGAYYVSMHGLKKFYPYARLVDDQGRPLPVFTDYNPYIQQTSALGFQDWTYDPAKDIAQEEHKIRTSDYVANLGLRWRFMHHWQLDVKYQFEQQSIIDNDLHKGSSYFTRGLINTYTQLDSTGKLSYAIPLGGIADIARYKLTSHQARVQLGYRKVCDTTQDLSFTAGFEFRGTVRTDERSRQYAVGNSNAPAVIDTITPFTTYILNEPQSIPTNSGHDKSIENFVSGFGNVTYKYRRRYILSGNIRKDGANLFGDAINRKLLFLWSAGAAWHLDREKFYKAPWLPQLTLRSSVGATGNVSWLGSAYTTINSLQPSILGTPYLSSYVTSPSNTNQRWEKVQIINIGVDFALKGNVLTGTVEFYKKTPTGLMAQQFLDPTYGGDQNPRSRSYYYTNYTSMSGKGLDVELISRNLSGDPGNPNTIGWTTNYIFSYATSRVTRYSMPAALGKTYLGSNFPNPVEGRPLYAVYAYKWLGLDSTGAPLGSYKGHPSKEWTNIYNTTPYDSMVYMGPAQPTIFGAVLNTFKRGCLSLSFSISYKFGYYFRKPALSYSDLINDWNGSGAYASRWQKTGDERVTNVPSFKYLAPSTRDLFYSASTIMVDKADNIRLEDINISYDKDNFKLGQLHFPHVKAFLFLSNLGVIWTANKDHIDPYYNGVPKDGKRYSLGITITY